MTEEAKIFAWSHSRVNDYKKCPLMLYHKAILKDVPFVQSEQMKWGDRVHKALEYRVRDKVPLVGEFAQYEPIAAAIDRAPGQVLCENKITLNPALRPTGYFADDAYVRVIVDVMKINASVGFMGDYKTGKISFDESQLKLFAAVGFEAFPQVEKWTTAYIWTQSQVIDPAVYTRDQLPKMWEELLQVPSEMQKSFVFNHWPAKPGRACKRCDVNRLGKCDKAGERYQG
jgi:hypothetical protein